MKNLKSLQVVALAGVAVALTAGCSSTSADRADNSSESYGAYRWVSSGGWVPITDAQKMTAFPVGWVPGQFGPVSYETYLMAPPADAGSEVTIASDADLNRGSAATTTTTTVASDADGDTRVSSTTYADGDVTVSSTTYHEGLQPGDTFVEAAGADGDSDGEVRRVLLYTPFNSTGVGR